MFKSIKHNASAEIVEKKSKFIANIFYIESKEEAENLIKDINKKYHDARHNCYAYSIMTKEGIINKMSDDGEPSGTAGNPMLNIILKKELINVLVIVTRYFGGILLGIGVGFVIRYGACLDGVEIVAILINKKTSFSVGQVILLVNLVIYIVAGIIFGWDRALYSILTYTITFKIIDMVSEGLEQAKSALIITNHGDEIARTIYKKLGRTVTFIEGEGLISGKKVVLYVVVTRIELRELKRIVEEDDISAFMTITDVSEIVGNHIKNKNGLGS